MALNTQLERSSSLTPGSTGKNDEEKEITHEKPVGGKRNRPPENLKTRTPGQGRQTTATKADVAFRTNGANFTGTFVRAG